MMIGICFSHDVTSAKKAFVVVFSSTFKKMNKKDEQKSASAGFIITLCVSKSK